VYDDGANFALSVNVKKPADILRNSNPTFEFSDFLVSSGFWVFIWVWRLAGAGLGWGWITLWMADGDGDGGGRWWKEVK
jgi:hypothetical protein